MEFIDILKLDAQHRIFLPEKALEAIGAVKGEFVGIKYRPGYIRLTKSAKCKYMIRIDEESHIRVENKYFMYMFLEIPKEVAIFVYKDSLIIG